MRISKEVLNMHGDEESGDEESGDTSEIQPTPADPRKCEKSKLG
jgi:hypothetical protein